MIDNSVSPNAKRKSIFNIHCYTATRQFLAKNDYYLYFFENIYLSQLGLNIFIIKYFLS